MITSIKICQKPGTFTAVNYETFIHDSLPLIKFGKSTKMCKSDFFIHNKNNQPLLVYKSLIRNNWWCIYFLGFGSGFGTTTTTQSTGFGAGFGATGGTATVRPLG